MFRMNIPSGLEFKLEANIIDQEGRSYIGENSAIAKIVFVPGQDLGKNALIMGADA